MAGADNTRFYCSCGLSFPNADRFEMHLVHGRGESHHQVDPPQPASLGFLPDWLNHYLMTARAQHA